MMHTSQPFDHAKLTRLICVLCVLLTASSNLLIVATVASVGIVVASVGIACTPLILG
jgi:hypothetical protein